MPQVHGLGPADARKHTSKDCDKRDNNNNNNSKKCIISLSRVFEPMKARYTIGNIKVNNLLFTDNLLSSVHAISKDIDLDYGIMKCGVLVFKKVVKREGIKLSDGQVVKEIGEESYKIHGNCQM